MSESGPESLSPDDRRALAMAVNPPRLDPAGFAEVRAQFDTCANRHAVVDDFLLPAHLPALRDLINRDGDFGANMKVSVKGESVAHLSEAERRARVDASLFETIPDRDRFISQEIYSGAAADGKGGRPANTDRLVRGVFRSAPMHRLLSAMSGMTLNKTMPINLKRHGPGHFLRRHSDATGGRKLCGVLYLHEDWQPEYGGRFLLYREDGTHIAIDPKPNRLLLFDVTVKNDHAIEELSAEVPGGWWRSNYSIWFR